MNKPKAVIMDLGDTIVENVKFSFIKGLKYLFDEIINDRLNFEDIMKINTTLKEASYDLRDTNNLEVKFLDYLRYLSKVVDFDTDLTLEEIEYNFMEAASVDRLIEEVVPLLLYFKENSIPVYILSNSTFSTNTLKKQIEKFGILSYFKEVFSTADYIFRKPNPLIFKLVSDHILNHDYNLTINDIWFIGNDYRCDIKGASSAGIYPIWYNKLNIENKSNINCTSVKNYNQLIRKLITNE